jgi:hypothetical protein
LYWAGLAMVKSSECRAILAFLSEYSNLYLTDSVDRAIILEYTFKN